MHFFPHTNHTVFTRSTYDESLKCAITMLFLFTVLGVHVCGCVCVWACVCVFLFIHVWPLLLLARLLPSPYPPHRNYSHGWGCRH